MNKPKPMPECAEPLREVAYRLFDSRRVICQLALLLLASVSLRLVQRYGLRIVVGGERLAKRARCQLRKAGCIRWRGPIESSWSLGASASLGDQRLRSFVISPGWRGAFMFGGVSSGSPATSGAHRALHHPTWCEIRQLGRYAGVLCT